jgi:hypothetical protein
VREYATPAAFRAAVEAKLRERARRLGAPAFIVRRQAALERLVARLTRVAPGRWALKGGFALETRLGERARVFHRYERVDTAALGQAIQRVFVRRRTHSVPSCLPPPPSNLAISYRKEAEHVGLSPDMDKAHRILGEWLDPVLVRIE